MTTAQKTYPFFAVAVFVVVYLLPLGVRPLFVPDEARYGEIAREMIAGGNWVTPHLNGLRYFEKPVLGYWLHAASIMLFGENSFAVRFPSAMAVGGSTLLIFLLMTGIGRPKNGRSRNDAALAALVLLVCLEVAGVGTFGVLDSLLAFFLTGVMVSFFVACESVAGSGRENGFLALAGFFCGLAFLVKGFLALAVPVLALVPFLCWQRRFRDIFRMAWLPLCVAVAVALPWAVMINNREPDYWQFFFWNEHVRRFLADNAQHKQSFWYYVMMAPAIFMPWTFVTPAALGGLQIAGGSRRPRTDLIRFCLCWLIMPFLFFSLSSGKLPTYLLPCFPPFAILLVLGLKDRLSRRRRALFMLGAGGLAVFLVLLCSAVIYLQFFGYDGFYPYSRSGQWLMPTVALAVMAFLCLAAAGRRDPAAGIICLALGAALFLFSVPFAVPDRTLASKAPGLLLQRHKGDIAPADIIISGEEAVLAVCWFFQRDDVYLLGGAGELDYGLGYDDAAGRLLDTAGVVRLIKRRRGNVVLVTRKHKYGDLARLLPEPVLVDDNGPKGYIFARY